MGWYGTNGATRESVIAELTKSEEWTRDDGVTVTRKALAKSARGRALYVVHEQALSTGKVDRFIGVYLLGNMGDGYYGYKPMDESMGPCEVGCPLKFLDMVPDPGGFATGWRERVRTHHVEKNERARIARSLKFSAKPGDVLVLNANVRQGSRAVVTGRDAHGRILANIGGTVYRIPPKHVERVEISS